MNELVKIYFSWLSWILSDDKKSSEKNIVQFLKTYWKSESLIDYTEHITELSAMIKKNRHY